MAGNNKGMKYLSGDKRAVMLRERKLLKIALEGGDAVAAAIEMGYSKKTAAVQVSKILSRPRVKIDFQKRLDAVIPDSRLIDKYSELLDAKRTDNGKKVKDNPVQLKCADSVAKLKGRMVTEQPPQDIKIIVANYADLDVDVKTPYGVN